MLGDHKPLIALAPSSRMYAQIPHLRNLRKHHPFPFFKCPLIYLLTSVFHFVTQSGVLIWKQMTLLDIRSEFITEGYEIFIFPFLH